jgi:hypothetical protein
MVLTEDYTQKGVLYKLPKELRELAFKDCFTPGNQAMDSQVPAKDAQLPPSSEHYEGT